MTQPGEGYACAVGFDPSNKFLGRVAVVALVVGLAAGLGDPVWAYAAAPPSRSLQCLISGYATEVGASGMSLVPGSGATVTVGRLASQRNPRCR